VDIYFEPESHRPFSISIETILLLGTGIQFTQVQHYCWLNLPMAFTPKQILLNMCGAYERSVPTLS
jgi:hypothetical protein